MKNTFTLRLLVFALLIALTASCHPKQTPASDTNWLPVGGFATGEVLVFPLPAEAPLVSPLQTNFKDWLLKNGAIYGVVNVQSTVGGWLINLADHGSVARLQLSCSASVVEIEGQAMDVVSGKFHLLGGQAELAAQATSSVIAAMSASESFRVGQASYLEPVRPTHDHPPKLQWIQRPRK